MMIFFLRYLLDFLLFPEWFIIIVYCFYDFAVTAFLTVLKEGYVEIAVKKQANTTYTFKRNAYQLNYYKMYVAYIILL